MEAKDDTSPSGKAGADSTHNVPVVPDVMPKVVAQDNKSQMGVGGKVGDNAVDALTSEEKKKGKDEDVDAIATAEEKNPATTEASAQSNVGGTAGEVEPEAETEIVAADIGTTQSETSSLVGLDVDSQEGNDADSAIGSESFFSSTASARSSVYDFIEENGRKYHRFREGRYMLPNDEIEQDRLDLQHHLFLLTLGELYLAPIKDLEGGVHNALDIATGTGIWAIDFANKFPSANVIGMDLSPIQPDFVPSNCRFEVDDADDTWLYSHQFDYIHGRALTACFESHRAVFKSAFDFTRPGGYFEVQDVAIPFRCIDSTMKGSAFERWHMTAIAGATALGKDWTQVPKYRQYFEEAGFVDVVERRFVWPLGTWAKGKKMKILGSWFKEDIMSALQGVSMAVMTRGLGMSTEEIELLIMGARDDMNSGKVHVYAAIYVVYGRKPK